MDKYTPGLIQELKYPREDKVPDYSTSQKISHDIFRPIVIQDNDFPFQKVADEVVGPSVNTLAAHFYRTFV